MRRCKALPVAPHTERQSPEVVPRLFGFLKVNYEWEGTTTQGREFQIAATFLVPPLKIGKP
jgi:hypothetical protein